MAIKHLPDGQDFSASDFSRDFGFHGSAEGAKGGTPPYASEVPTRGPKHTPEPMEMGGGDYAHGGHVHPHGDCPRGEPMAHASGGHIVHHKHGGHSIHHPDGHVTHHHHDGSEARHMARGGEMMHMHPHGHHVMRVEHHSDGRVLHHHDHGGHTVHHPDGHISHHHEDGSPVMGHEGEGMAAVGMHSDSSTYVGGGAAEHHARHGDGYAMGGHARLPRSMTPMSERKHSPIGSGAPMGGMSPVEKPPRNPMHSTTPRNSMPGGQMGYGVEPSDEPDMAGSEQGIPQMKRGGHHRGRHREHEKA